VNPFLTAASAVSPAFAAQGPGVANGTASPLAQTLVIGAIMGVVVFIMAGVVRGAICYWRGARR
jgi:hypothetical protein